MMFLDNIELLISTLSPVHIGTAEDYLPTNYVIDKDALYAFDTLALAQALPPPQWQTLQRITTGHAQENTLLLIQKLIHENRAICKGIASHFMPVAAGVSALYDSRIGQSAQNEGQGGRRGRQVFNRLEIERTFYNPVSRHPVLPGSSLKGAIRTALLDVVNAGQALPAQDQRELKQARKAGQIHQRLQQRLLQYSFKELDADPLRLVRLADAAWQGDEDVSASEVCFAVDRPRRLNPDPAKRTTMADEKGLYQLLETIPALRLRAFRSTLLLQQLGDTPQPARGRLPEPCFRWRFEEIAAACNAFYRPQFAQELQLLDQLQYVNPVWGTQMRELLAGGLVEVLDSNQAFLLRVGRHSGAEAVTLNGLRNIKIMLGKDQATKKPRVAYEDRPRTIWLAADSQRARSDMQPFGWILVERDNLQASSLLHELAAELLQENRQWLAQRQQEIAAEISRLQEQQAEQQRQREIRQQQAAA
ncbi:MAG: type III-A CRISPR-associated RAMP protein Csm5, partial [Candidatus Competibacteraceae bacterium]|nr:type III-A CRISPR-associated RAMP protein Csm5 [Candidatus Competibacteraceae bacterium]